MKLKLIFIAIMAFIATATCSARDEYSTDVNVLPAAAKTLISKHFQNLGVNQIKIDRHSFGGDDYEVALSDGTEIDFDSKGNLEEVDCGRSGKVPGALILKSVRDYVVKNYPKQNIIKYEVKRKGYEVELNNGLDLVFDKQGKFRHIDD